MNTNTLIYLIVTIATLIFSAVLLIFTSDPGIHSVAIGMATLAIGHWLGYSSQLNGTVTPPVPASAPVQEAPKQA